MWFINSRAKPKNHPCYHKKNKKLTKDKSMAQDKTKEAKKASKGKVTEKLKGAQTALEK